MKEEVNHHPDTESSNEQANDSVKEEKKDDEPKSRSASADKWVIGWD